MILMFQFDNDVRELRMIFEGQDHIHQSINAMNRRMNEVMGIAQQLSSQVTNLQNQGGAVQQVTYYYEFDWQSLVAPSSNLCLR